MASRGDPNLRQSVIGLGISTTIAAGLLATASLFDGEIQGAFWVATLVIDVGGPLLFGVEGWKLEPMHFAERHGLIVLIALGESIVAIGLGAQHGVDAGIIVASVLGIVVAACFWWLYFDVVATVAASRLTRRSTPGRDQNSVARDSYSILHFPMVAGIVLVALGMKKTLGHVEDPLKLEVATAFLGGAALYLLAHVAFRLRNIRTFNKQRFVTALVLCALIPLATEIAALATLSIMAALFVALIVYETVRFRELRDRIRHQLARELAGG